jgi:hypothetical protein
MTDTDTDRPEDAELLRRLETALPRVSPPPDLFSRILDEVGAEAKVVPIDQARSRRLRTSALGLDDDLAPVEARAAISSPADGAVSGTAEVRGGHVLVSLRNVPAAPSGHHYEVWVLPEGSDEMLSVGTFDLDATGDVELDLTLPASGPYAAVDVSMEEDDGPEEHSDTSLASGAFS